MSTREGEMAAQLRHGPDVCDVPRETGDYYYCPQDWQGSVTRNAPGKSVVHGDDWEKAQAMQTTQATVVAVNVTRIR